MTKQVLQLGDRIVYVPHRGDQRLGTVIAPPFQVNHWHGAIGVTEYRVRIQYDDGKCRTVLASRVRLFQ